MDYTGVENANEISVIENIEDCSPAKPRIGRFLDIYSPEHLNLTPKPKEDFRLLLNNNEKRIILQTPERLHKIDFICSTVKPHRYAAHNCSFEANQSFPRVKKRIHPVKMELETPNKSKPIDIVRVDGPNGLRFNSSLATSEVAGSPALSQSGWQQAMNTTKAVFTVESNTFKILIVNNKASSLLGYTSAELCGLKFVELLHDRSAKCINTTAHDGDGCEDGTVVLLSGKVVELSTKSGGALQVSLWIRQLDNDGPCLIVAEPVSCKNVVLIVESDSGTIVSVDGEDAALIFQAEGSHKLVGLPITSIVPSIKLPQRDRTDMSVISKQKLTGRSLDGGCFPLCLWISKPDAEQWTNIKHNYKHLLEIHIRVTFNVSGLLVVEDTGRITACNPHFAKLTFGKTHAEVIGRHIEEVIPNFCRESDLVKGGQKDMTLSPVHNGRHSSGSDTDEDSCGAFNGSQKSACTSLNVHPSILSQTQDKSSSALCLDNTTVTHTPTPTQDMVSSISTTEQRNDLPELTSGLSGISIDEDAYCQSSISKSRSENILKTEQSSHSMRLSTKPSDASLQSDEVTPTGNNKKIIDPSVRLSLDSSKYKSLKVSTGLKDDKTSFSLDLCDSNETSADFLTPINEMPASGCEIEDLPKNNGTESTESLSNDIDLETQTESGAPRKVFDGECPETPQFAKRLLRTNNLSTSTPQASRGKKSVLCECSADCQHKDGTYKGIVLHKDGTELNVMYSVSSTLLSRGARVRCVWLCVTPDDAPRQLCSLASTADNSLLLGNKSAGSRPQSMSLMSQCGEEQVAGEYSKHYVTLKQIGKGAYGCVKMAYRRSDRLLCVAKFIVKEKIGEQFFVERPDGRKLPLEISLLLTLNHPNIVKVLDVYENDKYFQLVMERHGAGMDLFEFIERRPALDEPLISYIFRQIGQAVDYLHRLNILHRDIKDENVIIDNKFQIKLIDFGSATFMSKDTLFSTFYGTTEYCSPEVLAGNKYAGPELEMWSMGITLYVLVFFVNPFSDIEDTIQGPLSMPHPVSEELESLLRWMLHKEPARRCSVPQLLAHAWLSQPVPLTNYSFREVVDCDCHEANPEIYFNGDLSPKSSSQHSLGEAHVKGVAGGAETSGGGGGAARRVLVAPRDPASDNYSLRSSAEILDISSKPISEAMTDSRSDATGHAACDIDCDCELYDDSWDECEPEQDSFS